MFRREKRRRMRRMLAGLFAGAAVLVPAAPAAIVHDDPADRVAAIQSQASTAAFVRADGPDGAVVAQPVLRRDAPDGSQPASYSTTAPQSAQSTGSEFDWSASGLGAATAALLLALGYAGYRLASRRGGMAQA
jgi:hypothetical protein